MRPRMGAITTRNLKNLDLYMAPALVLAFAVMLAMMYGWVGTDNSIGVEKGETQEGRWVAAAAPVAGQDQAPAGNSPPFSMGIGDGANGQMQLINIPTYSVGIGNGANGQVQLINTPTYGVGIGNGANGQVQLINTPTYGVGIGDGANGQMQLINTPPTGAPAHHLPAPAGLGIGDGANGQMQLINTPPAGAQPAHHLPAPAGLGIGDGANGQMQLINTPTYGMGIGNAGNSQLQLINKPGGVYLGLSLGTVTHALAAQYALPDTNALLVQKVAPGTPAERAGLLPDDILLAVDNQPIMGLDPFLNSLSAKQPGDTIKLLYLREGRQKSTHLTLTAFAGLQPVAATTVPPAAAMLVAAKRGQVWLGADIQNIDAVIKDQFQLRDRRGIIVSYVTPQSPAAIAGLRTGDVIIRLDRNKINDVKRFQDVLAKATAEQKITLRVVRTGQEQDLQVVLADPAAAPRPPAAKLPQAEMLVEGSWIGMGLSVLTANQAGDLGFPAGTTGILVGDVDGQPASTVGFQRGDLITAINSTPTPDMRQLVVASRLESGAVVDVLRGNRHLFLTVPPPGFTQQGTPITIAGPNNFKQVAATQAAPAPSLAPAALPPSGRSAASGRLAIIVASPSLDAPVAGDQPEIAYLLLIDPAGNAFTSMPLPKLQDTLEVIRQQQIAALIGSDISPTSAAGYATAGVRVFPGVVGSADNALGLYLSGKLVAMR